MSLKRAALLQKKRRYADGGSEGEYGDRPDVGGYAGSGPGAGGIGNDMLGAEGSVGSSRGYAGSGPGAGGIGDDMLGEERSTVGWGDIFGAGVGSTLSKVAGLMAADFKAANARNVPAGGFPEAPGTHNQHEIQGGGAESAKNPFGGTDTPMQTTPAAPVAPGASGPRQYVWDPVTRQYTLANVGSGGNPMGYNQGQVFQMASGGAVGLAAGAPAQARFMRGGGTGLSDSIPVQMDDGGQGWLADGEFVIPADVVSGLGGGSSEAGAKLLYSMMERIRQQAHGHAKQVNPVNPQQVLPV